MNRDSTINISLRLHDGNLVFRTRNDIMRGGGEDGTFIGMANCRSRLEMLYGGRYVLNVADDGRQYEIELRITLK